jgi:predicted nucleotidyltransferase
MILHDLVDNKLIHPPRWLPDNMAYLAIVGSESYGANLPGTSDQDLQGFCIPPKSDVFPHLRGEIPGFGTPQKQFEYWEHHHVLDVNKREFDVSVYSIVKFFHLAMQNNPNILDILCVPDNCVKHITGVGQLVRDNRRMFFHAGCFDKFRGYASAQMAKIKSGANRSNVKRAALIEAHGYDTKFLMHVCRLALECEQILLTGDLDLKRDSQFLLSVRRGDMTLEDGERWWVSKARDLETAYANCRAVPREPDEDAIKRLLVQALEMHYGDLTAAVRLETPVEKLIAEMDKLVSKYRV